MPIVAVGNPNFLRLREPNGLSSDADASSARSCGGLQKASLESDPQGECNLSLNRRVRDMGRGNSSYGKLFITIEIVAKIKRILDDKDPVSL